MSIRLLALMALIGCGDKSADDDDGGDTSSEGIHCYVDEVTFKFTCEEGDEGDDGGTTGASSYSY